MFACLFTLLYIKLVSLYVLCPPFPLPSVKKPPKAIRKEELCWRILLIIHNYPTYILYLNEAFDSYQRETLNFTNIVKYQVLSWCFAKYPFLQKQLGMAKILEAKNNVRTYLRINMGLHSLCFLYSIFLGQGLTDCIFF